VLVNILYITIIISVKVKSKIADIFVLLSIGIIQLSIFFNVYTDVICFYGKQNCGERDTKHMSYVTEHIFNYKWTYKNYNYKWTAREWITQVIL